MSYARSEAVSALLQTAFTICPSANQTACDAGPWTEGWTVTYVDPGIPGNTAVLQMFLRSPDDEHRDPVAAIGDGITFNSNGNLRPWRRSPQICDRAARRLRARVEVNLTGRVAASQKPGFSVAGAAWRVRNSHDNLKQQIATNVAQKPRLHADRSAGLAGDTGIGLLGIAKLMLFSSHSNDSAYLRSQATALAYEILDDMRANRQEAIIAGTYNTAAAVPAAAPGALCEELARAPLPPACIVRSVSMGTALEREQRRCESRRAAERSGLGGDGDGRPDHRDDHVPGTTASAQATLNPGAPADRKYAIDHLETVYEYEPRIFAGRTDGRHHPGDDRDRGRDIGLRRFASAFQATSGTAALTDGGRFALNFISEFRSQRRLHGLHHGAEHAGNLERRLAPCLLPSTKRCKDLKPSAPAPAAPPMGVAPAPVAAGCEHRATGVGGLDRPAIANLPVKNNDVLVVRSTLPNAQTVYVSAILDGAPVHRQHARASAGRPTRGDFGLRQGSGISDQRDSRRRAPTPSSLTMPAAPSRQYHRRFSRCSFSPARKSRRSIPSSTTSARARTATVRCLLIDLNAGMNPGGAFTATELVPDIEAMQILYGLDTNNTQTVSEYVTADQVADFNTVMSVKIALLAASAPGLGPPHGAKTYNLLGNAGHGARRYPRSPGVRRNHRRAQVAALKGPHATTI